MNKKIKKRLVNQKGISTVEFVISFLVFIMLFSFIFDLTLITYKQYVISEQATQMAYQIAKQSGIEKTTPYNFPGGAENYYTTTELYNVMERKMSNLQIPSSDWSVVISSEDKSAPSYAQLKSFTLAQNHSGLRSNYRDYISVKVTYNYKWGLWSQFVPGEVIGTMVVERHAFSEYNHDYSK